MSIHYAQATGEVANRHSQLVRSLYESGIIGTIFFAKAFTHPVTHLTRHLSAKRRYECLVLALLLRGCFFGHRSSTAFIYVGMVIVVYRVVDRDANIAVSNESPVPIPGRAAASTA